MEEIVLICALSLLYTEQCAHGLTCTHARTTCMNACTNNNNKKNPGTSFPEAHNADNT